MEKFNIEYKVLLYKSVKTKVYKNKFRKKWTEPYYIYDIIVPEAYKLRTIEDKVLRMMINIKQLKKYYE